MIRSQLRLGLVAGALLLGGRDARATLGGTVASVAANQQHLSAARTVVAQPAGERHELRLTSGTLVQEYVSAKGVVYAVTWHGHRPPDLEELLGGYFPQLANRAGQRRGGHHHMLQTGSDFVVETSGHNRSFSGRAWVPSLLPAGVTPQTLTDGQ